MVVSAHDYDAGGKPVCAWDDPDAQNALITGLVTDAHAILDAVADIVLTADQADAVGLLALVAGQDVEPGDEDGTWRIAHQVAADRVISTVDPEARHMHKSRSDYRDGYKAHVAVEPETGLITACVLTPANTGDGPTGVTLLDGEKRGLQVLADSAYGSGEVRVELRRRRHHTAIKAIPLRRAIPGGFDRDDFSIDHRAGTATCPAGHTRAITPSGTVTFGAICRGCPHRERCTRNQTGRTLQMGAHDAELVKARRAWREGDFIDDYRQHRPMVERSIAWLVAHGHRRVRYRGIERNQLGLAHRVAAINLRRLINLGLGHNGRRWILA